LKSLLECVDRSALCFRPDLFNLWEAIKKESRPLRQILFVQLKVVNIAATAFLRRKVLEKLAGLKPGDPAGAVKIAEALDGLPNKWFAKILGLSEADLDQDAGLSLQLLDDFQKVGPAAGVDEYAA
jgi:hypothetical protein